MSRSEQKRMRRVMDALGGLQKLEQQRAAGQLEQQQQARRDLEEISDLADGESLAGTLFGDLSSRYRAGLSDEIEALTAALAHSSSEALKHRKRVETLSVRVRTSQLQDERESDQRELVDRLLTQQTRSVPVSGKLAGLKSG